MQPIRIGTRSSPLALRQTQMVCHALQGQGVAPQDIQVIPVMTTGDSWQSVRLSDFSGKSMFTSELEKALLRGDIDMAIHSFKDMSAKLPADLEVTACLPRDDARDYCITDNSFRCLDDLPQGALIGTASMRRQACLLSKRPDLKIDLIRGNIESRIRKVRQGDFTATLLSYAGLVRMGMNREAGFILEIDECLPAAAQGVIAVQTCPQHVSPDLYTILRAINHQKTEKIVEAERSFMRHINGSCHMPLAAHAVYGEENKIMLSACLYSLDGQITLSSSQVGCNGSLIGAQAAKDILEQLRPHDRARFFLSSHMSES